MPDPPAESGSAPPRMVVSLFASHPLMLGRLRLQLNRPDFEVHAYLLPARPSPRAPEVLPGGVCVIDAHDTSLIQQVLIRLPEPRPRVLVLADDFELRQTFALLFLGVRGFVRYDRMANDLVRAVQVLATGAFWLPRLLLAQFVDHLLERFPHPEPLAPTGRISRREREVLDGILCRLENKEIAARLGLSERTVKFHVSNLLRKFQVKSRYDLYLQLLQPRTTEDPAAS